MAVTRLKRKDRRNKAVAKNKVSRIQQLNSKPVIKNVDVEAITNGFSTKAKPAEKKVEEPKEEAVVETAAVEEVKEKAKPKKATKSKKEEEVKAEAKEEKKPKTKKAPKETKEEK